jgi:hypothetical protein
MKARLRYHTGGLSIRSMNAMGIEVAGIFGLIWLIIVIWAIVKTAQSSAGPVAKILWILILLFFPLVGLIVWLLLGPKG